MRRAGWEDTFGGEGGIFHLRQQASNPLQRLYPAGGWNPL